VREHDVGFDSFEGLPEDWVQPWGTTPRGTFSMEGRPPALRDARVEFVRGWFQNTLYPFLADLKSAPAGPVLVHYDADIYTSTLFILSTLWNPIPEYYFVFDEFLGEEIIALNDFSSAHPVELEFLCQTNAGGYPNQVFGRMRQVPYTYIHNKVTDMDQQPNSHGVSPAETDSTGFEISLPGGDPDGLPAAADRARNEPVPDLTYRCPTDLTVTKLPLRRVMVIGSCLLAGYRGYIEAADGGCPCDFLLVNNSPQLPKAMPKTPEEYDFQILQIPMRSILPDHDSFRFPQLDHAACEALLKSCTERLTDSLEACMKWNVEHGLLTFVWNFMLPQQNPMGRLLPRYDLRNRVHFTEKLNEALAKRYKSIATLIFLTSIS
jgi:hypothetical protein